MSERREEVLNLKGSPINPPCPQAPQDRLKGCSGRRNLSLPKNKLYSIIGVNQGIFNQENQQSNKDKSLSISNKKKALEKKNPPSLTKRDLFLFELLESYGVLSTQQIKELIFKGINTRTILRRLRILKQRGFIYSSEGLPHGALAWTLNKKSALLFKQDTEKIINKNNLQHDVAVSSIRIQLERLKIAESWTSEHVLKKEIMRSVYKEKRDSFRYEEESPLVPDSLFITKHEGEMKAVALELEFSLKSRSRYKKIFSKYKKKKNIGFVWYVVLNQSVGEILSKLWDKYALWGDCKFAYSTLKEVFRDDFKLPEPREAKRREEETERIEERTGLRWLSEIVE